MYGLKPVPFNSSNAIALIFQGAFGREQRPNAARCGKLDDWRGLPIMPVETVAAVSAIEELHAWEAGGAKSAEALTAWVGARLAAHETALAALVAVEGQRTTGNSLRLYDAAIEQLSLAGSQAGVLNSVAADKAVRDQAQQEAQRVAMAASALSLNRQVYDALVAMDVSGASPATQHFVQRTLLSYRLAGVNKDPATRDPLQSLHEKATHLSLDFSRNIQ